MKKVKKSRAISLPKLSIAILKGVEKYPKQAYNVFITAEGDEACVVGGALGAYGLRPSDLWRENKAGKWEDALEKFYQEYGISIYDCNDEGMDRIDIAGMLIAIGE